MAEGILKERPAEEVAARIAQQNQEEQDIIAGRLAGLTLTGRKSRFNGICGLRLGRKIAACRWIRSLIMSPIMMKFTPSYYI